MVNSKIVFLNHSTDDFYAAINGSVLIKWNKIFPVSSTNVSQLFDRTRAHHGT